MKKIYSFGIVLVAIILHMVGVVSALTADGYSSKTPIKPGLAVSLAAANTGVGSEVELASISNKDRFTGVTVDPNTTTVTTTDESSEVYVVTTGEVTGTVTDLNGEVKKGNYLVLSPLKGALMKAGAEDTAAVAIALEDINDENTTTDTVNNRGNTEYEVKVSTILIDLTTKTIPASEESKSFLILFGSSLTGKDVSAVQVIVAFVIFFLLLIIEGSIIYGSIYSSINALGRNPLSKGAVYKELAQVTFLALLILGAGLVAIYLVLWA